MKCSKCHEEKPASDFYARKESSTGYRKDCKVCCNQRASQYGKRYYQKNKQKIAAKAKTFREENPEVMRERYDRHKEKHPMGNRTAQWKYRYGISLDEVQTKFESQGGRCACCEEEIPHYTEFKGKNHLFHIDHNHDTGKIRGLLCTKCNTGLGLFNEDIDLIKSAIAYLEKYNATV